MSDQNQELEEQVDIQMAESEDDQIKKNPNLEWGLTLSKRQQKQWLERKNIRDGPWTPGHTIWLMHKTLHIKVNMNAGVFYNIARIGPTIDAPKPRENGEGISTVAVGLYNDTVQPRHSTTSKGIKQWKSWSGNIARLHLRHSQGKYGICVSTGFMVEQTNILYYPEYNTKEKQDSKALDIWTLYESTFKDNLQWHQRAMRDWGKVRRQWEISLVENEYFFKCNFAIFRPGLQLLTVHAAISLAKEDNCREELNVFKPGYTGEPLKVQKKTKATPAGIIDYLESESDNSDIDGVLKERRRLEKDMVINKNKEDNIGHLVFGYQQEPSPIVAPPALNDWEDLKRHLDDM